MLNCSSGGDDTDEIRSVESLQFDFSTIRVATEDFCEENKLGQGGFGPVYRVIINHCLEIHTHMNNYIKYVLSKISCFLNETYLIFSMIIFFSDNFFFSG